MQGSNGMLDLRKRRTAHGAISVTEERAGRWLQSTVIPALTGTEVPAMSNHPTATSKGAWRILVLDPSHDDPMWVVATVVELADVRPASPPTPHPAS
jgi:hypothetical protein